jgi:hypothetical protein
MATLRLTTQAKGLLGGQFLADRHNQARRLRTDLIREYTAYRGDWDCMPPVVVKAEDIAARGWYNWRAGEGWPKVFVG